MSLDEKNKPIFSSLLATVRAASQLAAQDVVFYKTISSELAEAIDGPTDRLLTLANRLTTQITPEKPLSIEPKDVVDNWSSISDVLDTLCEKTDMALDTLKKGGNTPTGTTPARAVTKLENTTENANQNVVYHSKTLAKPQLKFKTPPDNTKDILFKPLLRSKPHAAVESFEDSIALEADENGVSHYKQPYKPEILQQAYPDMSVKEPVPYKDWETTTATFVDTHEALEEMLDHLKEAGEIAVDLEHHDYRSFYGFVCLMQISTREQDWIVDTLALREELQVLNEVFADPSIIKVFHGAFMDIMWLQRDFGLYVVSLFDTYWASKALGFPRNGLAYLLETYANFETSKKYQLADWRMRPLPAEMLSYARSDTHFLLYIYDKMRNRLVEEGKLEKVLTSSRDVSAQRYETPNSRSGLENIFNRYNLSDEQKVVLERLYEWRDAIARRADESPRFVLPNHYLVALSVGMPTSVPGVLSAASGATSHLRASAKDVLGIIRRARTEFEEAAQQEERAHREDTVDNSDGDFNYSWYQQQFDKAVTRQQHLFSGDAGSWRLGTSSIYATEVPATSKNDFASRVKLVRAELQLHIPVPPEAASDSDAGSDMEDVGEDVSEVADTSVGNASTGSLKRKSEDDDETDEPAPEPTEDDGELIEAAAQPTGDDAKKRRKSRKKRKLKLLDEKEVGDFDGVEREQTPALREPSLAFNAFDYKSQDKVLKEPTKTKHAKKKPSFNPYSTISGAPASAKAPNRKRTTPSSMTYRK